jgi:hypothetical protein
VLVESGRRREKTAEGLKQKENMWHTFSHNITIK